jgi:beta-lactamase regulating signal transducer with metallopeptidase domain
MLWWLAQNALVAVVLAVVVGVLCRTCRFRPAVRHALWLIVLVKLIAPPLLPWSWPAEESPVDSCADTELAPAVEEPRVWQLASAQPSEELSPENLRDKWLTLNTAGVGAEPIIPNVSRTAAPVLSIPAEEPATVTPDAAAHVPSIRNWLSGPLAEYGLRVWLGAVAVMAGLQLIRTVRFRRRLARGRPAPRPLTGLVADMAERLGIRPPATLIIPGLGSPMVWGLGRPVLLWPAALVGRLSQDCQRAVIVHELAHLRRRDHWVGWLQLLIGCLWWWNPVYRWINNQVGRNAELACDAWVIQVLPAARRVYAEALLEVTQLTSRSAAPLPALGMAGGHPDFERRLIMIMRDRVPCHVPMLGLALIGLIALVALPGWSLSQQPVQLKTEIKKGEKKLEKDVDANVVEVILEGDVLQVGKGSSESDRLDRLEKQLETLLQEVKAMRTGAGQHAVKELKLETKPAPKVSVQKDAAVYQIVTPHADAKGANQAHVEYTWVAAPEHGDHSVALTRATYKMPKEKAEALAKFLSDQVKGQVLETKVDNEGIIVTTTPHIQRTIHDFISLVQGAKKDMTFEIKGAEIKFTEPEKPK